MTNETLTQDRVSGKNLISKKSLMRHEQFCMALLILAENGADIEKLIPLLEDICEQAEDLI